MLISRSVDSIYRVQYSKMVASLVSYFGLKNMDLAEDIVQDTFIAALSSWTKNGMPDQPEAWLYKVCKNKTLNALSKKQPDYMDLTGTSGDQSRPDHQLEQLFLDHEIKDNQLRLLFACSHPLLSPKSQVILILKNLCGLRVEEICRGLAMKDETVTKVITRSRQTLAEANVPLHVPFLLRSKSRLNVVHTAIYLLFSEGYSATHGDKLIRKDLCLEAMRLIRSITDISEIRNGDTYALLALMCFHTARFDARIDEAGEIMELEVQNRALWDKELITLGMQYLKEAREFNIMSRFLLEAAIASVHCSAKMFVETKWDVIKGLYDQLCEIYSSPFNDLNRSVAVFYLKGGSASIHLLEASAHLNWLKNYYLFYALMGKIFQSEGKIDEAKRQYEKAMSLTNLEAERKFFNRKIESLKAS